MHLIKQDTSFLSLVNARLNAFSLILSIYFIDNTGRKKLALISLSGGVVCLLLSLFDKLKLILRQLVQYKPFILIKENIVLPKTCYVFDHYSIVQVGQKVQYHRKKQKR